VIKLNEIMMKMQLGLESKRGAMLDLGEEFPDEKLQELFEELIIEAKQDGAQQILKANIAAAVMELTGIIPEGYGEPVQQDPGTQSTTTTATGTKTIKKTMPLPKAPALGGLGDLDTIINKAGTSMFSQMVTQAYGTKIPQARNVDENSNVKNT
jgi:hypothetical protein